MRAAVLLFSTLLSSFFGFGQESTFFEPADSLDRSRLRGVIITEGVLYTGIMVGLNEMWYADYDRVPFQFFNDNAEWRQIDKVGHAMTGYYVGVLGMDALRWAGVDERKSRWYGGGLGWMFLTSFEFLDGTSAEWGFSNGDMIANTVGAGVAIGQDALWHEQRILLKWSSNPTPYAELRPNVLGSTWNERLMKDYNGHTYWASVNLASFANEQSRIPDWLNVAVGYSIDSQIDGRDRPVMLSDGLSLQLEGKRQYLLSLDADLWRIKTGKPWLRTLLKGIGFIKIPAPALEFSSGGATVHWIYF